MPSLKDRTSFTTDEVYLNTLEYTPEQLFKTLYPNQPLHPLLAVLLEKGYTKIKESEAFKKYELEYIRKNDVPEYARRVNITEQVKVATSNLKTNYVNRVQAARDVAKAAIGDYANSILATMKFGPDRIELGMMTYSDVLGVYNNCRERSQTEFKKSELLGNLLDIMRKDKTKLVKDVITPKDSNTLWNTIDSKKVALID